MRYSCIYTCDMANNKRREFEKGKKRLIICGERSPIKYAIYGFFSARDVMFFGVGSKRGYTAANAASAFVDISSEDFNKSYPKYVYHKFASVFNNEKRVVVKGVISGKYSSNIHRILCDSFITATLTGWAWFYRQYNVGVSVEEIVNSYALRFLESEPTVGFVKLYTPLVEKEYGLSKILPMDSNLADQYMKRAFKRLESRFSVFNNLLIDSYVKYCTVSNSFVFECSNLSFRFLSRLVLYIAWNVVVKENCKPIAQNMHLCINFRQKNNQVNRFFFRRMDLVTWFNDFSPIFEVSKEDVDNFLLLNIAENQTT